MICPLGLGNKKTDGITVVFQHFKLISSFNGTGKIFRLGNTTNDR